MQCLSKVKAAGAVLGVTLNATMMTCAVLLQCCTCDLCGCGSVFEFIFAAAGTAWCVVITQPSDCTHQSTNCKPLSISQGLSQERVIACCSQIKRVLSGVCRWAIAAIVLMKKSWAADDANVSQVTKSLRHLFHAGIAPSEPKIEVHHDWGGMCLKADS